MLPNEEQLTKEIRQGMHQQCFKIGSSSAMQLDKTYLNIIKLGTTQQCNKTRYTSAM